MLVDKKGKWFFSFSYRLYDAVSLEKLFSLPTKNKKSSTFGQHLNAKVERMVDRKKHKRKSAYHSHNILYKLKSCTIEMLSIENHTSDEMLYSYNLRVAWGEMKDSGTIQIDMFTIQRARHQYYLLPFKLLTFSLRFAFCCFPLAKNVRIPFFGCSSNTIKMCVWRALCKHIAIHCVL